MAVSFPSDAAAFAGAIHQLSPHGVAGVRRLLEGNDPAAAQQKFLSFVRAVWPGFIHGSHHDIMADVFERIERGMLRRAIINLPPRHTKSMFASVYFNELVPGKTSGPANPGMFAHGKSGAGIRTASSEFDRDAGVPQDLSAGHALPR
jgi:hypothetical protein